MQRDFPHNESETSILTFIIFTVSITVAGLNSIPKLSKPLTTTWPLFFLLEQSDPPVGVFALKLVGEKAAGDPNAKLAFAWRLFDKELSGVI